MRLLENRDYYKYTELINEFRKTKFTYNEFCNFINIKDINVWILCNDKDEIIGSGTILYERKLIHDYGLVSHIEDIVVSQKHRGKEYGKKIINYLIQMARGNKCYKITLNCNSEVKEFYSKLGFTEHETCMRIDL